MEEMRQSMGQELSERYTAQQKGTAKMITDFDKMRKELGKVRSRDEVFRAGKGEAFIGVFEGGVLKDQLHMVFFLSYWRCYDLKSVNRVGKRKANKQTFDILEISLHNQNPHFCGLMYKLNFSLCPEFDFLLLLRLSLPQSTF